MFDLDSIEVRVLGSLIEKELTTPEYYPLSLNALVNACNQKSSREPVVNYDESTVQEAIAKLKHRGLAMLYTGSGSRVVKYGQRLTERLNLGRREVPLLALLMLRGPQTVGELRGRSERMYDFSDLEEVETVLRTLTERDSGALVAKLPAAPGTKEPRWAHLLSGEPQLVTHPESAHGASGSAARDERIAALETEVTALRSEIESIKQKLRDLLA